MRILFLFLQLVFMIAIAPLVSGCITKIKNNLRMRQGPGVLQPYYTLVKLFSKEEVISQQASWIFRVAPFVVIASSVMGCLVVPLFIAQPIGSLAGGIFALIFIFSLGRFFLSLAGLDTASAFTGMGSSREMFISSLAEPVALLSLFTVCLNFGTTNIAGLNLCGVMKISSLIAAIALTMVTLAETARIPIDNQETHLELTMIHEAMVLEYSGKSLALIEFSSYIKQIVFFSLISMVIFPCVYLYPFSASQLAAGFSFYCIKIAAIAVVVAFIEVLMAKMRLFRAVDFLSFAFMLAAIAVVVAALGA